VSPRPATWLGAIVVVAVLAATGVATFAAAREERRSARDALRDAGRPAVQDLAAELRAGTAAVEDLRALLESSSASAESVRRFAAAPLDRQSALVELAWAPEPGAAGGGPAAVAVANPARFGPGAALAAGTPQGRETIARARARSAVTMSAPLELGALGSAVLVAAPVHAPNAPIGTEAERARATRGTVSGVLSLPALEREAAATLPENARLLVRDGDVTVFGSRSDGWARAGAIAAGGRTWRLGLSGGDGPGVLYPAAVAAGGLLLAAALALVFAGAAREQRPAAVPAAGRRDDDPEVPPGELTRLRRRHQMVVESAGDGIVAVDGDGLVNLVNPAAARMWDEPAEALVGGPLPERLAPALGPALAARAPGRGEMTMHRRDGTGFPVEYTITPIEEEGEGLGVVLTFRDITVRKRIEARTLEDLAAAEHRAAVDPLTGLANHRVFHERLRTEAGLARRRGRNLSLVLMDLDHFKLVNDLHGHQAGDRVLEHAAAILADATRAGETVARVGGEEFAMLLPEADEEEALRAAERVRRAIAAADFPTAGRMTISAGVCTLERAETPEDLYRMADGALYGAKSRGRNVVVPWTPEAQADASAREQAERAERQQALVSIRLLARVVDAKDPTTRGHSERVAEIAAEIAEELGWPAPRLALLRDAGMVHDVGKIGVPDAILLRRGPLTPDDYEQVKEHAEVGARIVAEALAPEQVAWVRGHHERWDGTGYPDRLTAEEIPEGARILALAEAWDVMTSDRPDNPVPSSPADAIADCRVMAGSQFWEPAVEALARRRATA
jgi:diguanylate cyclase (GGDEF)-like protein/PAS domain S-box-containing protein/putative nucleotidyltransferase with HDIG domain